jgi:3-hydroxybutyrate dehydrogenase
MSEAVESGASARPAAVHGWALITGAASGIGLGIATALAQEGRAVALADLDDAGAETAARQLTAAGARALALPVDVTRDDSVAAAIAALDGPITLLVNNAGVQHVAPLEELPPGRFAELIDIMLTGSARVCAAVLPRMRAQGHGRIINMGSIHSLVASPYKSAYVAAKHGLVGLTRTLALETAATDITVNVVCPAYVRTPLVDAQIEAQARAHGLTADQVILEVMLKPMPKGRFIEIDEIVGTIRFLCSDAARNLTGQCLVLDGGWTAQ